jgi:hypothetical protein
MQERVEIAESLLNEQQVKLRFEGLNTLADVYVNGYQALKADNMHRTSRRLGEH